MLRIHRDQIERYGGLEGVRDLSLLQSAVAAPAAGLGGGYLHEDLFAMAAAYLFHIARSHPFLDGNKRTGAVAATVFLTLNGIELNASESAFETTVLGAADGTIPKTEVAAFFRRTGSR
ncbi:MAG: type II toxin-antitoxin system death-on-curing family toxin [Terriglobia bacterium]